VYGRVTNGACRFLRFLVSFFGAFARWVDSYGMSEYVGYCIMSNSQQRKKVSYTI
jgi:hypothetical protein